MTAATLDDILEAIRAKRQTAHERKVDRLEMARLIADGYSCKQLAAHFGVSVQCISNIGVREGLTPLRRHNQAQPKLKKDRQQQPSAVNLAELKGMLLAGASLGDAAKIFGVSRERVRQIAVKAGLPTSGVSERRRARKERSISMLRNGASVEDVAKACDVSPFTVSIWRSLHIKVLKTRFEAFVAENAAAFEAIKAGASIRSQSKNKAHETRLGYACRKLGIVPKTTTGGGKGRRAFLERQRLASEATL